MEDLGGAPTRTEVDLRAALAELGRRAPGADEVLSALHKANSRRRWRSRRLDAATTVTAVDAAEEDRMPRDIRTSAAASRPGRAGPPGRDLARHRRARLLAGGLGLAAAMTAVAVVFSSGITAPPGGPVAARLSARQILLAAASAAAARPESSGTYWYVKQTYSAPGSRRTVATWTARNGDKKWVWAPGFITPRHIVRWPSWHAGWSLLTGPFGPVIPFPPFLWVNSFFPLPKHLFKHVAGEHPSSPRLDWISFAQLQGLPTSPAALQARLTVLTRNRAVLDGRAAVFESLINLVTGLPAPPQVRAAAFRALAMLPIVTTVVWVHGHPGLRINTSKFSFLRYATLVVDPATSQVQAVVNAEGGSISMTAGWVNRVP